MREARKYRRSKRLRVQHSIIQGKRSETRKPDTCWALRALMEALRYASPVVAVARLKGDFCALRHAMSQGRYQTLQSDRENLAQSLKGRLFCIARS
jgi:hypothetical protein